MWCRRVSGDADCSSVAEAPRLMHWMQAMRPKMAVNLLTWLYVGVLIICHWYMKLSSCTCDVHVDMFNVQVTDCGRSVFPMNADTDQMDEVTVNLYNHLCSLLCQRDFYIRVSIFQSVNIGE